MHRCAPLRGHGGLHEYRPASKYHDTMLIHGKSAEPGLGVRFLAIVSD